MENAINKNIKKFGCVFFCTVILTNVSMPIFAYSRMEKHDSESSNTESINVRVSKGNSNDKLMEIDIGDQKISSHLAEKSTDSKSNAPESREELCIDKPMFLEEISPKVSARYKKEGQDLKEDFILYNEDARHSFVLKYDIGSLSAVQIDIQNILLLDKDNRAKMLISAPCMTDASGACSNNVSLQILDLNDGVLSVNLAADSSWLQDSERQYPVEIDPRYSIPKDKVYRKGDRNKDIVVLKSMLLESGFGAGIPENEVINDMRNEVFGSITERFVMVFQRKMGLNETGIVDSATLDAITDHLIRKGILDTQQHIDEFLVRVEERTPADVGVEVGAIKSFFRRVNFTDVVVTLGITGAATIIGAVCLPLVGVAGVVAGSAAVGAVANGVSEVVQQRSVGDSVDAGRVAIKVLGGAVKGGVAAIPGMNICGAFRPAVDAAGKVVGQALSEAVGDATGEIAKTLMAEAITPALLGKAAVAGGGVIASAAATNTAVVTGVTLAAGAAEDFSCAVKSGESANHAAANAVANGALQALTVPVAAVATIGGATCGAVYVACKEKTSNPPPPPPPVPTPVIIEPISPEKEESNTDSTEVHTKDDTVSPRHKKAHMDNSQNQLNPTGGLTDHHSDVTIVRHRQPVQSSDEFATAFINRLDNIKLDRIRRDHQVPFGDNKLTYYRALSENLQSESREYSRIRADIAEGRLELSPELLRQLDAREHALQEQAGIVRSAEIGDPASRWQLDRDATMNDRAVFNRQMSTPSVQKILRFGRIISRWQEDDEILIGSRE